MLGREVHQPVDLVFPLEKPNDGVLLDVYLDKLISSITNSHEIARNKLGSVQKSMKKDYDLRVLEKVYKQGDLIYVLNTKIEKGKSKKLSSPWKGPGIIASVLSPYLYSVKLRNSIFVAHHDRIKICPDKNIPNWILKFKQNLELLNDSGPSYDLSMRYCSCRKPYRGEFMIQCDSCAEWFHGACVNITATDALDIEEYECTQCTNNN